MLFFFPLGVLDEIWDVIESVYEGFLTYSLISNQHIGHTETEPQCKDRRRETSLKGERSKLMSLIADTFLERFCPPGSREADRSNKSFLICKYND